MKPLIKKNKSSFRDSLLCGSARTVGFDDEIIVQDVVGVVVVEVFVERRHDVGVHVEPRSWAKTTKDSV